MDEIARSVAQALLRIGAIGVDKDHPITFKSGIVSPIYIDNRQFPFHPEAWKVVIDGFMKTIEQKNITFDVVGGIESAGIPHSAALGYALGKPSVFIRKAAKDHGTKKMVEGGNVTGKTVLLIEDLITTGGSSLHGVNAVRNEGGMVHDCLVITSYGFSESSSAFAENNVTLHALTSLPVILDEGKKIGKFSDEQVALVLAWSADPHNWPKS